MTANKMKATGVQDQPHSPKLYKDLRAPGLLAKRPLIGLIMFIFGSLVFGALTYNLLAQGPLLAWDRVLANTLPAIALQSPAFVKGLMAAGFYLGEQVIIVLGLLLGVYFILRRSWQELVMLTIGIVGSTLIFLALSHFIGRPRPPTQIWVILNIPGFPSGHAISVIVFYGLLAYLLVPKITAAFWKVIVVVAALLIISFVGFSRIFTGGHYLTDILAGYAVGIAWFGAVYTLIEIYYQKRRNRVIDNAKHS